MIFFSNVENWEDDYRYTLLFLILEPKCYKNCQINSEMCQVKTKWSSEKVHKIKTNPSWAKRLFALKVGFYFHIQKIYYKFSNIKIHYSSFSYKKIKTISLKSLKFKFLIKFDFILDSCGFLVTFQITRQLNSKNTKSLFRSLSYWSKTELMK